MEDTSAKSGNERALEFHNFERTVLSTIEGGAIGEHIAALETALLHHAAGSRVVDEKVAPDDTGPDLAGAVLDEFAEDLGADALVPVWLADPIPHLDILLSDVDIAVCLVQICNAADDFARGLQFYGPGIVVAEDLTDDLKALLDAVMRSPAGTRADVRVRSKPEEGVLVGLPPSPEYGPLGLHRASFLSRQN